MISSASPRANPSGSAAPVRFTKLRTLTVGIFSAGATDPLGAGTDALARDMTAPVTVAILTRVATVSALGSTP